MQRMLLKIGTIISLLALWYLLLMRLRASCSCLSSKLRPFSCDFMHKTRHINAPTNHVVHLLEQKKKTRGHRPFPILLPPFSHPVPWDYIEASVQAARDSSDVRIKLVHPAEPESCQSSPKSRTYILQPAHLPTSIARRFQQILTIHVWATASGFAW